MIGFMDWKAAVRPVSGLREGGGLLFCCGIVPEKVASHSGPFHHGEEL
jgi:hypothetical protein